MAVMHRGRVSRLENPHSRTHRVMSLDGAKMSVKKESMVIRPGQRYTTCTACNHVVRVVNALFGDKELGIREKDPVLANHDLDGATCTTKTVTPCAGSARPVPFFNVKGS